MTSVVEYLGQLPELCVHEVTKLLEAGAERDPSKMVETIDALCENEDVPVEAVSTLAYDCAERVTDPHWQRRAIERYLVMKCTEALELERVPLRNLDYLFDALRGCRVPDQCRDASLAMARVLLIDDHWYLTLELADTMLDWLQGQWVSIIPARLAVIKRRTIGNVAATMKALLHDVRSQCRAMGLYTKCATPFCFKN